MNKEVNLGADSRTRILEGINKVCDSAEITLGPKGRNVTIDRGPGVLPVITNDGVSIAREITFKDRYLDMGASIAKSVAEDVNDEAGDATTTSLILTKAIANAGVKYVKESGDIKTKESLEESTTNVLEQLDKMSRKIDSDEDIIRIATYSSENEELGKLIASTIKDIGTDGVILVEESYTGKNYVEKVKGMNVESGVIHPVFSRNEVSIEYNGIPILITDQTISSWSQIEPLIGKLLQGGQQSLVIIAEDIEGEALTALAMNMQQGRIKVLPIKAPSVGDNMYNLLEDIAVLTNGTFVSKKSGFRLEEINPNALGLVEKIKAKKKETIIISNSNKEGVDKRIVSLKEQIKEEEADFDKDKIKERIAKLKGGVASLKIASNSETNSKYLRDKIEDAISSTRSAIEEGVVVGGGIALKNCVLGNTIGDKILKAALIKPFNILNKDILESELVKVIDPVKAIKAAVKYASSAAGTFLTTGGSISLFNDKDGK